MKDIAGYEGFYQATEDGRIWSLPKHGGSTTGKFLKPRPNNKEYLRVVLHKDNVAEDYLLSRLIAETFIENPNNLPAVDHIDRIRTNNHMSNLRWVTHQENNRNRTKQSNNTSGFTGVIWNKGAKKWSARIKINGKLIHLGHFAKKEDAIKVRKSANIEYGFSPNHGT